MVSAPLPAAQQAALDVLARPQAPVAEVLAALALMDRSETAFRELNVGIAANVTVDLLGNYLRRHAYAQGVRLIVHKGNYDDLLGDVEAFAGVQPLDLLVILPFFDNLQASWEAQLGGLDEATRQAPMADYLARLELALAKAHGVGQVLLAGVHGWLDNGSWPDGQAQVQAITAFNTALQQAAARHPNVRWLDTAGIVSQLGARQAFDARFYYRGKAPYTPAFLNELGRRVSLVTRGFGTVFHKVLVLDCDNTLWGGIVGEDGVDGIQLDPYSYPGNVFWTVQQQALALERRGVLLCLCSKNNEADVAEVFARHPAMVLTDANIVARRVNWADKASNLRALAAELNLGLESFVFIDDSAMEADSVRQQLPMVKVLQVPAKLADYPALMQQVAELFLAGGVSAESSSKTRQYRQLVEAAAARAAFDSQDDYLRSLELKLHLHRDAAARLPRITELINKTNQFNLTTRRLGPGEVARLAEGPLSHVYAFSVSDRLADHGLVGVLITEDEGDALVVHSFLMSCRIIGRGVEFAVWKPVLQDARSRGKTVLRAAYVASAKNALVADFYDRLGLRRVNEQANGSRDYEARLAELAPASNDWVELIDG